MKHIYHVVWEETAINTYTAQVAAENPDEAKTKAYRGEILGEAKLSGCEMPIRLYPYRAQIDASENGRFYDIHLCAACMDLFRGEDYSFPEDLIRVIEVPTEECDHYNINRYQEIVTARNKEFLDNYPQNRPAPMLMLKLPNVTGRHAKDKTSTAGETPYQRCLEWIKNWHDPDDLWSTKIYEFLSETLQSMPVVNHEDLDDIMKYLTDAAPDTEYYNELLDAMQEDVAKNTDRNAPPNK